jgi:ABC-type Mn2+/Zn2+ transport system permease subunit
MKLQRIKMTLSGVWMALALVFAVALDLPWKGVILVAALGVLPPLAILLLWNEPRQTMSESINEGRR